MKSILIMGYGSVAQCLLPILLNEFSAQQIVILDKKSYHNDLNAYINQGLQFKQIEITPENYAYILEEHLLAEDVLIDLSTTICSVSLIKWCHEHGVMYINTAIEIWDTPGASTYDESITLYARHQNIENYFINKGRKGPTILLEHGANPGIVSHLVKKGLIDLGLELIKTGKADSHILRLIESKNFPHLAKELGIKVIHISERDTQVSSEPKQFNQFVNTWSVLGLFEEGINPTEIGWGSHENSLPPDTFYHKDDKSCIWMQRSGKNVWVKSWVPNHPIIGMAITHGEAITINKYLSIYDKDKCVYCPTVHYAYCPTDATISSLHELEMRSLELQPDIRIMNDDIIGGQDILGVLLMGNPHMSWWTGSLLDIHEARRLVPHQNATTVQVAGGVFAGLLWMLKNTKEGLVYPDYLPHEDILKDAEKYWGGYYSTPTNWLPSQTLASPFDKHSSEMNWQFNEFMVKF